MMKIAGIILIVIGIIDLVGSYIGFDLWGGLLGIDLPDLLRRFSSYIEIAAGYFLMKLEPDSEEDQAEAEAEAE